jgi:hypothetical protein
MMAVLDDDVAAMISSSWTSDLQPPVLAEALDHD